MKLKMIAAAATLAASQAYAVAPGATANIEFFISGASAQDKNIGNYIENNLCILNGQSVGGINGDFDTFLEGTKGKKYRAWSCVVDHTKVTSANAGDVLVIHKRSKGGSGYGVVPVAQQASISRMDLPNANCTDADGDSVWNCDPEATVATVDAAPLVGVSDVEPKVFKGYNAVAEFGDVAQVDLDSLTVKAQSQVVFGVPVTTELRDVLQQAQGLTVGAEDEANMPSLSSNLVRSLFTGQVTSWYDVVDANNTDLVTLAGANAPDTDSVALCVRDSGSGTRAQFMINFLRTSCLDSALPPFLVPGGTWPMLKSNPGSGDMGVCVSNFDGDGDQAAQDGESSGDTVHWAIGYQSTEKNMDLGDNYRFVKIDGAAPTLQNVANDKYTDWVEQSMQWNTAAYNGSSAVIKQIITFIADEAGQPGIIAQLNPKYVHQWGQGGYMAKPTDYFGIQAPAFPFTVAYPVNRTTRSPAGQSPDSCRPPVHVNGAWPAASAQ